MESIKNKREKRIMLVFGTRPEAIKMAPLVKEFQKYPEQFQTIVCVTGQHREMLDQVLHLFEIVPDYDFEHHEARQDLYDVTAGVLIRMRDVLKKTQPDVYWYMGTQRLQPQRLWQLFISRYLWDMLKPDYGHTMFIARGRRR